MSELQPQMEYSLKRYQSTPEDVQQLRSIAAEWVKSDGFWTFDHVLASLHQGKAQLYYFAEGEKWVAAILTVHAMDTADVCYMYVREAMRGKGLGRSLLKAVIEKLFKQDKIKELLLEVKPHNAHAIQIYRAVGFEDCGLRPLYYRDGHDAVVMKCVNPLFS